ncbi:MAG: aminomethyl transferase family protein, partial [Acidobacteria bacterium]|nr:aminomethyl transferase family protein [Acidobacteriota bacterium]
RALAPGSGCYAAWLTPQGRMLTDLHVFALDDMILLDVPADVAPATLTRLDECLFSEDVQLTDSSESLTPVWIHGPLASASVQRVLPVSGLDALAEYGNVRIDAAGSPVVVVRVSQVGAPGFGLYAERARAVDLQRALEAAGAPAADPRALDAARIEAGYPLFGVDMTEETIPLEAGIEDRAISFTKGCYVGQEVIIRVLHRGHGRVARRLVGLRIEGEVPGRGAAVHAGEREIGRVTSAASSPRLGSIALAYVQRDHVAPGTRVEVAVAGGRTPARVSDLPLALD